MSDRLVTLTMSIDRNGHVYEDTQTHGNSFADVYRGFIAIRGEIERQIGERRLCPFNPKFGKGEAQFTKPRDLRKTLFDRWLEASQPLMIMRWYR